MGIWTSQDNSPLTTSWAALATLSGSFDGDQRKLPSIDGLGNWVYVVWNATTGKWDPDGVQTLSSYGLYTSDAGTTALFTTTPLPTTTFTGGPQWAKTKLDITVKMTATANGCTALPVNLSLGAFSLIADTQVTLRRKSFKRSVDITSAAVQYCHSKVDNVYIAESSDNAVALLGTVNTAANFNVTLDIGAGWTNAGSITVTLQEYAILWRR